MFIPMDVTAEDQVTTAVQAGVERFGAIDAVVNNAGQGLLGLFEGLPQHAIRKQMDVNLFGAMNICRAALPYMRARRSGVIVNVSSAAGYVGLPLSTAYAASKFALEGFSQALRYELMPLNIVVKVVVPGGMRDTNFLSTSRRISSASMRITDYGNVGERAERVYEEMAARTTAQASDVAEDVFRAVTDGKHQYQYVATDVATVLQMRRNLSDEEFMSRMEERFA
jgi:short-subunit dehydrogenase